jgi:hypothetical protein
MENARQRRDHDTGIILAPPPVVTVSNWRGRGRPANVNLSDYDPSRDGQIISGPTAHFEDEVGNWEKEMDRRANADSVLKDPRVDEQGLMIADRVIVL